MFFSRLAATVEVLVMLQSRHWSAENNNKGVLIKKGLQSGHVDGEEGVLASMQFVFSQPGVSSMIVGTINPEHLQSNVETLNSVLDK